MNPYMEQLNKLDRQLSAIDFSEALITWDAATLAPKNAVNGRGIALEEMSELYYNLFINDNTKEIFTQLASDQADLTALDLAKYKLYRELYDQLACIPVAEYAAFSNLKTKASAAWEEAKEKDDYKIFEPFLQKIIDFQRKYVAYRNLDGHPYSTLLQDYERGLTVDVADEFFNQLRAVIVPLLKRITAKGLVIKSPFNGVEFSIEGQKSFSDKLLEKMNFNKDSGIIAESVHPFTLNITRDDVRITTAYQKDNILSSIYSTIHECGHGLYEQNISEEIGFSRMASGTTMGVHESQSRIYENNVGRSEAFWHAYFPMLKDFFPEALQDATPEDCFRASNDVKTSLIRIEADELTYSLHIMVRYEIEKAIFEGRLDAKDLPTAWNAKYEEYLGLTPGTDAVGVLQDVHWSEGLFGYFPSYALGSAYAAQFEAAMNREFDFTAAIANDNLAQINQWLTKNIHHYGSSRTPEEILLAATGEPFDPMYFTDYLINKYSQLYHL